MTKIDKKFAFSIFEREIDFLNNAIENSENPFHFFYFSTINNKEPQTRTVVLRNIKNNPIKLYFNTDFRSTKISELKKIDSCSALFYDNKRRIQLRLKCKSKIYYNNELTKETWDNTPLQSRKCYMAPYAPSSELEKWIPNLPKEYLECDPDKKHSFEGYKNFSVVELEVQSFEIIELHYDGHIRFKLNKDLKDLTFISS